MTPHATPRRGDSSNDAGRRRDARVIWLLGMHPVTASMLVRPGFFPCKAKALKRLRRLAARNRIRLVGTVSRKSGRPEHVYCVWRPKSDQLLHEVELTELCLRLDASEILRGPHVSDTVVRPDAEVWIDGALYYLELDRATAGYDRVVSRRFALYRGCPHLSLWVCPSPSRRDGLRRRAQVLRATALFTTLAEALATPHGPIWIDHRGERAALPASRTDTIPG